MKSSNDSCTIFNAWKQLLEVVDFNKHSTWRIVHKLVSGLRMILSWRVLMANRKPHFSHLACAAKQTHSQWR